MASIKSLGDEELVVLVRTKDKELYREIVRRYQEKLIRYAVYLLNDKDQAADVVQEALIKAFINLQGFNAKKKFSSWIYRIVHNQAVNQIKKRQKEVSLDQNNWINQIVGKNNVEEDLEKKEAQKMVRQYLRKLPLIYRSVLTLYYLEEKSYREISDVLRIPVGTVGVRINRGKKLMRTICEKKLPEPEKGGW